MAESKHFFTAEELRHALGLSLETFEHSIETGAIPKPIVFGLRLRRWPLNVIDKIYEAGGYAPLSADHDQQVTRPTKGITQ